jgi:hypothetical protein
MPTLEWGTWKVLHSDRLRTNPQTLDQVGKASKGQTLITKFNVHKKFYNMAQKSGVDLMNKFWSIFTYSIL